MLVEGDYDALRAVNQQAAALAGPIVPVFGMDHDALAAAPRITRPNDLCPNARSARMRRRQEAKRAE